MLTPEIREKIAVLSFVAACCVVDIHVDCSTGIDRGLMARLWADYVHGGLWRCVVPLFFFISGYLLVGHVDEKGWWRQALSKRIGSIIVPYFVWTLLYLGLNVLLSLGANLRAGRSLWTNIPVGWSLFDFLGLNPCAFPGYYAFWYLRALMVVVLLSPVLVWGIRTLGAAWGIVLLALASSIQYWGLSGEWAEMFHYTVSLQGLLCASCGVYLRMRPIKANWKIGLLLLGVACGLLVLCKSIQVQCAILENLIVIGFILGVWFSSDGVCLPRWLTSLAFPVYCCHLSFLMLYRAFVSKRVEGLGQEFLTWCVILIFSFLFSIFLRKRVPSFSRLAFGGR